jgi:type IV pilus assembly protein PilX
MMREEPGVITSSRTQQQSFGSHGGRDQRGAVLLVALIFLILLTILALSASGRSLLQERMVGGLRNAQQATMSANTALRGAEWQVWSRTLVVGSHMNCLNGSVSTDDGCTIYSASNTPYGPTGDVTKFLTSQGWVSGIGHAYTGPAGQSGYTSTSLATAKLANNPVYIIEDLGLEMPPGVSGSQHESGATGGLNAYGGGAGTPHIYRITARATGGNANTVRVLQTTFDAQANN